MQNVRDIYIYIKESIKKAGPMGWLQKYRRCYWYKEKKIPRLRYLQISLL